MTHTTDTPSPRIALLRWSFYYYLVNVPLFWLLGLIYIVTTFLPHHALGLTFIASAYIGHFALLSFFVCVLLLIPCILICPRRACIFPLAALLTTALLMYLMIDGFVYSQYRFHFNGVILQLAMGPGANQIFHFSWLEWLFAGMGVLSIIALQAALIIFVWRVLIQRNKQRYGLLLTCVLFIALLTSHVLHAWGTAAYYQPIVSQSNTLPLYYGLTARNFLIRHHLVDTSDLFNTYASRFETATRAKSHLHYPLKPIQFTLPTKPYNILILAIDSWRFDMLTASVTPHLYQFAQANWRFLNHTSGGDATRPGIFSLFYGIPSTYWDSVLSAKKGPALISTLIRAQYRLGIFSSASLLEPPFYITAFVDVPHLAFHTPGNHAWQRDRNVTQHLQHFLTQRTQDKRPFFGFIFYDTAHSYDVPKHHALPFKPWWHTINHLQLNNHFNPTAYRNRYKNAVHYIDHLAGKVLAQLKQSHQLDNTVVIITGDHGEEFNDNGLNYWGHAGNFTRYQVQVPLVVHWPGQSPKTIRAHTTHYDITPTLMKNVLGVRNAIPDYSIGHTLLPNHPEPFTLVGSYKHNGFITAHRIVTLFKGGFYGLTDKKARPIEDAKPDLATLKQVFDLMRRYYY